MHDSGGEHGEWKTIYEDEVEERWVTLKVYESEDDGNEDPVVRVTIATLEDAEQDEGGRKPGAEAEDNSITLEPDPVEDLEEESLEIGFNPVAAAWIVSKVPGGIARQL
ncbi:hypothetical protein JKG68_21945 [Microvirga aerilata]|uniref:Uncharacterized protein n=1 Tax=Microvirga aerilata TaxID=670292 RepID=A0A937D160_9HYPH|nr:hypothetical protein [Microvirga aerilata]MBL0406621.1 hypothetical protein [Microvirga aerilata]